MKCALTDFVSTLREKIFYDNLVQLQDNKGASQDMQQPVWSDRLQLTSSTTLNRILLLRQNLCLFYMDHPGSTSALIYSFHIMWTTARKNLNFKSSTSQHLFFSVFLEIYQNLCGRLCYIKYRRRWLFPGY